MNNGTDKSVMAIVFFCYVNANKGVLDIHALVLRRLYCAVLNYI